MVFTGCALHVVTGHFLTLPFSHSHVLPFSHPRVPFSHHAMGHFLTFFLCDVIVDLKQRGVY